MGNNPTLYSYNGNVFPKLPDWDKESYPYAMIYPFRKGNPPTQRIARLFVSDITVEMLPGDVNRAYALGDGVLLCYECSVDYYTNELLEDWHREESYDEIATTNKAVLSFTPIWSNYDILNKTDGSIFLSASEPIPVYDSTTTSVNIGQVSPSPKGDWSEGTLYRTADIVRSGNSLYVALRSSLDVEPGISDGWSSYWMLVASDGQAGDIGKLVNALASAEKIVNMTVSATSILFSRNPYITKTTNEETGFLNLDFAIPHQGNPPDPVPVTPFFNIDAGSWEVKQITGTGGASYTEESLGVQDFSNLQYNFDEGMTWREFISSAYNVTVGGQFGGVENSMSSAEYATTGRKFAVIFGTDFDDTMEDFYVVCLATIKDTQTDWWGYPNEDMVYLNGTPVYPDDHIISGANYKMGNT